ALHVVLRPRLPAGRHLHRLLRDSQLHQPAPGPALAARGAHRQRPGHRQGADAGHAAARDPHRRHARHHPLGVGDADRGGGHGRCPRRVPRGRVPRVRLAAAQGRHLQHAAAIGHRAVPRGGRQRVRRGVLAAGHGDHGRQRAARPADAARPAAGRRDDLRVPARLALRVAGDHPGVRPAHAADHRLDEDRHAVVRHADRRQLADGLPLAAGGDVGVLPQGRGAELGPEGHLPRQFPVHGAPADRAGALHRVPGDLALAAPLVLRQVRGAQPERGHAMKPTRTLMLVWIAFALPVLILAAVLWRGPGTASAQPRFVWKVQSAWPATNLLHVSAVELGKMIEQMSAGRLKWEVSAAGTVVGAFEVLDAVNRGLIDASHAWPGYWAGKNSAGGLFGRGAGGPFGMDREEYLGWLYAGGGLELYNELLQKELKMNVVVPVFTTSLPYWEPLGWFKKPFNSLDDLRKMRFRTSGLGMEMMKGMGISVVTLAGGEVIPALERGAIEGAEWAIPSHDILMGFHNVA